MQPSGVFEPQRWPGSQVPPGAHSVGAPPVVPPLPPATPPLPPETAPPPDAAPLPEPPAMPPVPPPVGQDLHTKCPVAPQSHSTQLSGDASAHRCPGWQTPSGTQACGSTIDPPVPLTPPPAVAPEPVDPPLAFPPVPSPEVPPLPAPPVPVPVLAPEPGSTVPTPPVPPAVPAEPPPPLAGGREEVGRVPPAKQQVAVYPSVVLVQDETAPPG